MIEAKSDRRHDAEGILTAAIPRLETAELEQLLQRKYGLCGAFRPLSGERDQNLAIKTASGASFVLKIANTAEDPDFLACQNAALEHVAAEDPGLPIPRPIPALTGETIVPVASNGNIFNARLLTHMPGEPALPACATPLFRRRLGSMVARLDRALAGFRHNGAPENLIWDLCNASALRDRIGFIGHPGRRRLAERIIDRFDGHAAPVLGNLRRQFIHNDINQNNVMRGGGTAEITGIIDFGDMARSCLVNEIAIAIAHQLYRQQDVLAAATEFLEGYATILPIEPAERAILFDLVKMRLLSREIIAAWRAATSSTATYRSDISDMGWQALELCMAIDPDQATHHWRKQCPPPRTQSPHTRQPRTPIMIP